MSEYLTQPESTFIPTSDVVLGSWSWSRGTSRTLFVVLVLVMRSVVLVLVLHNGLVYTWLK